MCGSSERDGDVQAGGFLIDPPYAAGLHFNGCLTRCCCCCWGQEWREAEAPGGEEWKIKGEEWKIKASWKQQPEKRFQGLQQLHQ